MKHLMSAVQIAPLSMHDLAELTALEFAHRAYFEAHINARPSAFYEPGGVAASIEAAVREAQRDQAYPFVIRDPAGQLVGRVNLSRVRRAHFQSAELGYRIAPAHHGKGYASQAVQQLLVHAFGALALHRVEACASHTHVASHKVLRRNGFTQFGHSVRSFQLQGQWLDLYHFEVHADACTTLQSAHCAHSAQ